MMCLPDMTSRIGSGPADPSMWPVRYLREAATSEVVSVDPFIAEEYSSAS